jgi:hypothetical protein
MENATIHEPKKVGASIFQKGGPSNCTSPAIPSSFWGENIGIFFSRSDNPNGRHFLQKIEMSFTVGA